MRTDHSLDLFVDYVMVQVVFEAGNADIVHHSLDHDEIILVHHLQADLARLQLDWLLQVKLHLLSLGIDLLHQRDVNLPRLKNIFFEAQYVAHKPRVADAAIGLSRDNGRLSAQN